MKAAVILLACGILASSGSAVAQAARPYLPKPPASIESASPTAVRETVRQFATCLVAKSPALVVQTLDAKVGSDDFTRLIHRVASGQCLGEGALHMDVPTMRGALIEASYRREFGSEGPVDFASVGPIDYAARFGTLGDAKSERITMLAEFGDCVARADGVHARAMIVALPGGAAETAALTALRPHLTQCVQQNMTMSFDRDAFRSAIAEGLYRLSQATATATTMARQ